MKVLTNLKHENSYSRLHLYDDFPQTPEEGMLVIKEGILYIYNTVDTVTTWRPLNIKTKSHVHHQTVPAINWSINHSLETSDIILFIYESDGSRIEPSYYEEIDINSITVYFMEETTGKAVIFGLGDSYTGVTNFLDGTFAITGNIAPDQDAVYDFGNPTHRFNNIYCMDLNTAAGSIYMDGTKVMSLDTNDNKLIFEVDTKPSSIAGALNLGSSTDRYQTAYLTNINVNGGTLNLNTLTGVTIDGNINASINFDNFVLTSNSLTLPATVGFNSSGTNNLGSVNVSGVLTTPQMQSQGANLVLDSADDYNTVINDVLTIGSTTDDLLISSNNVDLTSSNLTINSSISSTFGGDVTISGLLDFQTLDIGTNNLAITANNISLTSTDLSIPSGVTVTINGNMDVKGTLTTISSENLAVSDNIIVLNDGETGAGVGGGTGTSGIEVERGTLNNAQMYFDENDDAWKYLIVGDTVPKLVGSTSGSSTFNTTTGVTITHNLGRTPQRVIVTPTSDPGGYLGEFWVSNLTSTTFQVFCSGTTTTTTFFWDAK